MNRIWLVLLTVCVLAALAEIQGEPFADDYILSGGGKNELFNFRVWEDEASLEAYKFYAAGERTANDTIITLGTRAWPQNGVSYAMGYGIMIGDLDRNGLDEIVTAFFRDNQTIQICLLRADPASVQAGQISYTDSTALTISSPPPKVSTGSQINNLLALRGDFDGDSLDELAVIYWSTPPSDSARLSLNIIDISDSLELTPKSSQAGPVIHLAGVPSGREQSATLYSATVADLDGDGTPGLLIAWNRRVSQTSWELAVSSYSFDRDHDSLRLDETIGIFTAETGTDSLYQVSIDSDRFFDGRDGALVRFTTQSTRDSVVAIVLGSDSKLAGSGIFSWMTSYGVYTGDITGDGRAEIINTQSDGMPLQFFQLTPELTLNPMGEIEHFEENCGYITHIANVVPDTLGTSVMEVVTMRHRTDLNPTQLYTGIYRFNLSAGTITGLDTMALMPTGYITFSGTGDIDGDIRLGTPRQFEITNIQQPTVILNAPPIHFDIFEDALFDIAGAYDADGCAFWSRYTKTTSVTAELQTTFSKDWGVSASVSTDHSFWFASVKSHFTTKYGECFEKDETASRTVTISNTLSASVDDLIYAATLSYKIWEYPIYVNGVLSGHIAVADPVVAEDTWFPSKSWSGYTYQPSHEVGNILSYREYADFSQNPLVDETIKGNINTNYVLNGSSDIDWTLSFSDFQSSSASTTKEWGIEAGATIGAWGVEVGIEGNYSSSELITHSSTISTDINLSVHFDRLSMSLGEVSYRVLPYAFWANNGALVIDYAVRPEISAPGGTPTWWQQRYGQLPDPCFILPWRYDPEKGEQLTDAAKREQTKDIQFFPREVDAGDTVTITTRVSNFSLVPTAGPVTVRFYTGDPDNGGTAITGIHGSDSVVTPAAIAARGSQTVTLKWIVPGSIGAYPRIYARIDPANRHTEIHKGNNTGWNILGKRSAVSAMYQHLQPVSKTAVLSSGTLSQGISFTLASAGKVTIELIDLTGRRLALASNSYEPGVHRINLPQLPAKGMYLCRMSSISGDGKLTRVSRILNVVR